MKYILTVFIFVILLISNTVFANDFKEIRVRDVVKIGQYEQDANLGNGPEEIEWIVLEINNGKALLLSKYCLESVIFYPQRVPMYWGISDLRKWMNGEFFQSVFSNEEKSQIVKSIIKNDNPHGMKGAGLDTEDNIFLLSKDEVLKYFPTMDDRIAYPTEYTKTKDITLDPVRKSCRWWTRTTGARKMDMWGIRLDGRMTAYGMQDVDWPGNTMRPAIWIMLDNENK